ncbi:glycosyltransferase family 2 protein [Pedobacter chinensis]|uniref:Glycosyltransferase family 2 protein n=1 Tax=Pedobacter chinensis TaxID=2282421 RepID=A0A369PW06_9SPHI|nr:glycosyltransferase [Pedobacter chinensis]RDC54298.1 glycosyltransferase family 2 protein [Pedobacter chinensis]
MKIAVLLTTFNRRDKTILCLESLKNQILIDESELEIFLTDDGSSDNTVIDALKIFPKANIFKGNGQLFWAGGMRKSWSEAIKHNFDFFFLVNDDTFLFESALSTMINCYHNLKNKLEINSIIVGSTRELNGTQISYGGKRLTSKFSIKYEKVFNETETLECDLGNANIMLVPNEVVMKIGILSKAYTHGIADYDYTLRAKRNKFKVYVAPGVLGSCNDDHGNSWKPQNTTLTERIKFLKSPKGLAYKEYLYFTWTFFPASFPFAFAKLWLKTLFPIVWDKFKSTN